MPSTFSIADNYMLYYFNKFNICTRSDDGINDSDWLFSRLPLCRKYHQRIVHCGFDSITYEVPWPRPPIHDERAEGPPLQNARELHDSRVPCYGNQYLMPHELKNENTFDATNDIDSYRFSMIFASF